MKRRFNSISQLQEFLPRVLETGNKNTGNWTTAQILYHLAGALEGSVEGIGTGYPFVVRLVLRQFRWFVTGVKFPPWIPIPSAIKHKLEPPPNADLQQQYERIMLSIDRFVQHEGEYPAHPVLGRLSREQWTGFHLRHCERHLSFILLHDENPAQR